MLDKNVSSPANNINCTNLRNRNGHAITSLSAPSVSEKNFSVVSCCYWSQEDKNLPGTGHGDDKPFFGFSGFTSPWVGLAMKGPHRIRKINSKGRHPYWE